MKTLKKALLWLWLLTAVAAVAIVAGIFFSMYFPFKTMIIRRDSTELDLRGYDLTVEEFHELQARSETELEALGELEAEIKANDDEIVQMVGPNVMIGNLLEQINDYSCSKIDDIVLEEDGDRIYVTVEYKDRLI